MADQRLLDYIKKQLDSGVSEEAVRKALSDAGWQNQMVQEAFGVLIPASVPAPAPVPAPPAGDLAGGQKPEAPAGLEQGARFQGQPEAKPSVAGAGQQPFIAQSAPVQPVAQASNKELSVKSEGAGLNAEVQTMPGIESGGFQKNEVRPEFPVGAAKDAAAIAVPANPNPELKIKENPIEKSSESVVRSDEPIGKVSSLDRQFEQTFGLPVTMDETGAVIDPGGVRPAPAKVSVVQSQGEIPDKNSGKAVGSPEKNDESLPGMDEPSSRGKKSKKILFAAIGLLGLVLIAGAGAAYYFLIRTPQPSGAAVFEKMAENMAGVKTAEFKGAAGLSAAGGDESAQNFTVDYEGSVDLSDPANRKSAAKFSIANDLTGQNGAAPVSLEVMEIDNALYVKTDYIPNAAGVDLSLYAGHWIKVGAAKFQDELAAVLPDFAQSREAGVAKNLTYDQINNIAAVIGSAGSFEAGEKLADEEISGTPCSHYGFSIDAYAGVDSFASGLPLSGEIWIGKKDGLLYKIASGSDGAPYSLTFKSFGQPVSVTVPESSLAAGDYLGQPAVEPLATDNPPQMDVKRTADMKSLFAAQKSWFIANKRFFTCGTGGGDCKGLANNFPDVIGSYLVVPLTDPASGGTVCGQDFVYCGLDNTKNSKTFCYYAKMEDGTFFTASPYGNFIRPGAPKTFKECQQGTLVE